MTDELDPNAAPASAEPAAPPPPPRSFAKRHWGKLTVLALIGLPALGMSIWAGVALSYSYSEGTRTGYVQKLSKKGWLCKSWEGELAMATAPGVSPQIFAFSIRNDSLAQALTADMGKGRVSLSYKEHPGVPTNCFGETPYYIEGYRMVFDDGKAPLP